MLILSSITLILLLWARFLTKKGPTLGKKIIALFMLIPIGLFASIFERHLWTAFFNPPEEWSFWQDLGFYIMEAGELVVMLIALGFILGRLESVTTTYRGGGLAYIAFIIWFICSKCFDDLYSSQMAFVFYTFLGLAILADIIYHIYNKNSLLSMVLAIVGTVFVFCNLISLIFMVIFLFIGLLICGFVWNIPGAIGGGLVDTITNSGSRDDEIEDSLYVGGKLFTKYKGRNDYESSDGGGYHRSGLTMYNNNTGEEY